MSERMRLEGEQEENRRRWLRFCAGDDSAIRLRPRRSRDHEFRLLVQQAEETYGEAMAGGQFSAATRALELRARLWGMDDGSEGKVQTVSASEVVDDTPPCTPEERRLQNEILLEHVQKELGAGQEPVRSDAPPGVVMASASPGASSRE